MRSVGHWVCAALLATQVACAGMASAQTNRECDGAGGGAFTEAIAVARIVGKGKTHFVLPSGPGHADCPGASTKCRAPAYLLPGNVVLTGEAHDGYVCASFINSKGATTDGWLPAARLTSIPTNAADDAAWIGNWQRVEASIKITRSKDGSGLAAEGEATWGAGDKGRVARGAVNMGEFAGKLRRAGDIALVADDDIASFETAPNDRCVVRLRAAGPYMLVEDNRTCGGMNVSFTGLYARR